MRTFGFASVLLGMSFIVTGCEKHLTPQQAEVLLTKTYSSPLSTAHFTCQEGERDWLYLCQTRSEPSAIAIQQDDRKARGPAKRVAVYQLGTYRGEPILNLAVLPDDGPIPSQEEHTAWANREMFRRTAEGAYAAKGDRDINSSCIWHFPRIRV